MTKGRGKVTAPNKNPGSAPGYHWTKPSSNAYTLSGSGGFTKEGGRAEPALPVPSGRRTDAVTVAVVLDSAKL